MTAARFADVMIPLVAAQDLRLSHAFGYLTASDGRVALPELRAVWGHFFSGPSVLDAMLAELDADGDGFVTLADFRAFHPAAPQSTVPQNTAPPPAVPPPLADATPPLGQAQSAVVTQAALAGGVSPLQMQTGFFRLLQGAAYRTFRESYSANSESHLRARDLPYTVADFAVFVRAATEFYLSLGLVRGPRARAEFARLVAMVEAEYQALLTRIATWDTAPHTPQMAEAEAQLEAGLASVADHRARFAEAIDYILRLRMHGVARDELRADSLTRHEMDRMRHTELAVEQGAAPHIAPTPTPYHDSWSPVILTADAPRPRGCIMPVAFWYDQFMPQLLLCASVLTDADLDAEMGLDAVALDAWHDNFRTRGAFDRYGTDLRDGFTACSLPVKRQLRQAWRLTEHYLNGLQKRRERAEFGRESGYLSQYVAFIDLNLGRSDIADAGMRLSFPYFIGPAVWCLLHTAANLTEAMDAADKAAAISAFKRFFRAFATMYPCPYCRYHLNRYVARNREVEFYPVEFLLLGQQPDKPWFDISLDDRLATIAPDMPGSMALFVWKLHNAVSSSIARTEAWYHAEANPLYTTRFWPGFDAEIAKLRSTGAQQMPLDDVAALNAMTRPSAELATLRDEIRLALRDGAAGALDDIMPRARDAIARIERALDVTGFLGRCYAFDPERVDPPPHLSAAEEEFARSGAFIER